MDIYEKIWEDVQEESEKGQGDLCLGEGLGEGLGECLGEGLGEGLDEGLGDGLGEGLGEGTRRPRILKAESLTLGKNPNADA